MDSATATARDSRHLLRALDLAANGRGRTSPNPLVGAVIARGDTVIGEGFHARAGDPHAEREALASVTGDPAGATMYVTLEPCAHHGRTPPCTEAIIEAGIGRVVVASDDPTPKAAGRGPGILRDEGIIVEMAGEEIARSARLLNQPFRKHARTGRPFVLLKSAMTLDGKVATASGDSQWISGEPSRVRAHGWRAEYDAVAVGRGTAEQDDPQLTARIEGVASQPHRVVFDSEARLALDSKLVRSAHEVPVTVIASRGAKRSRVDRLRNACVEVIVVSGSNQAGRVQSALSELGSLGIQSLMVEGGPHLAGVFLEAGEIDEVRMFVAPLLLGGKDARAAVEGEGAKTIAEAMRAAELDVVERIGDDVLIGARMREW